MRLFWSFLFFGWIFSLKAQTFTLSGHVRDTAGNPLSFANVIADGQDVHDVQYTITGEKGFYRLKLAAGKTYKITVTYLGYRPASFTITMRSDTVRNVVMHTGSEKLDEVVISYKPPIKIKEDTVTYAADKFRTGEERKLRQVLEKLPGVEVTENGQIFFNGKKVKRVLVENKTFFTGESRLAVDHIPADAVDDIQMIDNFQDLPYMKRFEKSDELVMNVKLKKDKKSFYFGDIEAGGGWKKRAMAQPSVFYYSPTRQWQGLAEWNNTGRNGFNITDYYQFEGRRVLRSLWQDRHRTPPDRDLMRLLGNRDNYRVENGLLATHWLETFGKHLELKGYVIANRMASGYEQATGRYFIIPPDTLLQRETSDRISRFTLAVVRAHRHTAKGDAFVRLTGKYHHPEENGMTVMGTPARTRRLKESQMSLQKSFSAETEWFLRVGFDDVLHVFAQYTLAPPDAYQHQWQSDSLMLLPFVSGDTLHFEQLERRRHVFRQSSEFSSRLFHVLNPKWQIFFSAGGFWHNLFADEHLLAYVAPDAAFNPDDFQTGMQWFRYGFYGMAELKTQIGKSVVRAGLKTEKPVWHIRYGERADYYTETLLLPRFSMRINMTGEKRLHFTYERSRRDPVYEDLIPGFYVTDPAHLFHGNPALKPAMYHHFRLRYYQFAYFRKKWIFSISSDYKIFSRNIRFITRTYEGQTYREPYLSTGPEWIWTMMIFTMKEWGKWRLTVHGTYSDNEYHMKPGGMSKVFRTQSVSFGSGLRYRLARSGEYRLSVSGTESWVEGHWRNLHSYHIKSSCKQRLAKGLYVTSRLDWHRQTGTGRNASYILWDATSLYHNPDSPWTFEFQVLNILNNRYKTFTQTGDIYIRTQNLRTFPRMILAKVIYSF